MTEHLVETVATTYQMQAWRASERCTCGMSHNTAANGHLPACRYPAATHSWEPMENGAAAAHWKPKLTARAAVEHASTWAGGAGGVGIPAMQVVELPSGRVIWRDSHRYPAAGDPVAPAWQAEVYAAAKAESDAERYAPSTPEPGPEQEALF